MSSIRTACKDILGYLFVHMVADTILGLLMLQEKLVKREREPSMLPAHDHCNQACA